MIAAPVAVAAEPVEALTEPPAAPKRGRPRIHANDAARQQAHRDKQADKTKLVAAIVRRVKGYLDKPSPNYQGTRYLMSDREYLQKLHRDLSALPLKDVRLYHDKLISKKGIQDLRGRLEGERSGEAPQKNGMSEIETIFAAVQQDEGGPWNVARPNGPEGSAPTSFDKPDAYENDQAPRKTPSRSRDSFDVLLDRAVEKVADGILLKNQTICECGGIRITCRQGLINHLHEQFEAGIKSREVSDAYIELLHQGGDMPAALREALMRREVNQHHADIYAAMLDVEDEDRAAGLKARRIERQARKNRQERWQANFVTGTNRELNDFDSAS